MSITFKFEKLTSTGSDIYKTQAFDDAGNVAMEWTIACDDATQLDAIATEAYEVAINPPTPEQITALNAKVGI